MQAGHAKLAPARARLEACDADPVLVRLCLGCLMTARTARPANAGDVAKAVHEFLASVEERAQSAELAAAEARIKAAEARRAHRLTLALAGTIVTALALAGGGIWWTNAERAQRAEERARRADQTRAAVEAAYGESIEFGQAGKPVEALASAQRALSLAENSEADAALVERAKKFVAKAELDVGAAERERKLVEQDETLRSRLIDLRLKQIATIGEAARELALDTAFTQAFHDYGVDLEGDDVVPALKRIRERAIAEEVALAFDDWGRLRRKVHGPKSEKAENLMILAMDLDPDPGRKRMREAIASSDLPVMLELTSPENLPKLEPGSIFVLSAALWEGYDERHADVHRILDQALHLHSADYVLQSVAGYYDQNDGDYDSALACRTAALSLRPGDLVTRTQLAETQFFLGRFVDAEATLRQCLAAAPTDPWANYWLGVSQGMLGDFAGSLASLQRAPEIEKLADMRSDLHAAQFYCGILTREEFARHIVGEYAPLSLATYLFALVDHPDPKQRDPQLVLRTLADRAAGLSTYRWPYIVETIARVRIEDWPGAFAVMEHRFKRPGVMILSPCAYDFIRSLICSHLNRPAEALAFYEQGMNELEAQTKSNPAAWEHSDAMRWRREAEAVLPK
jgi:tetratricopeptide (TPR) repeat protein